MPKGIYTKKRKETDMKSEKLAQKIYDELLTEALKKFDENLFWEKITEFLKKKPGYSMFYAIDDDKVDVIEIKENTITSIYILENYIIDLLIKNGFYVTIDYDSKYINYSTPKYRIRLMDDYYVKRTRFYPKEYKGEVFNDKVN